MLSKAWAFLQTAWGALSGFLAGGWALVLAVPKLIDLIKAGIEMYLQYRKNKQEEENEEIRRQIENAQTEVERQAALDRLARRTGRQP